MATWYASGRDSDGVPRYCRYRKALHPPGLTLLRSAAVRLRLRYDIIDFLRSWVLPHNQPMTGHYCQRVDQNTALEADIGTETRLLKELWETHGLELGVLLGIQGMVAGYALGQNATALARAETEINPFHTPRFLLRLQHAESRTIYTPQLGFLSSGFWNCSKLTSFGDLLKSDATSVQELRAHCHAELQPSSWISLTDSVSWLVEVFITEKGFRDASVAFIDVEKLERLAVLYQRSVMLALQCGIPRFSHSNPDGLRFTSFNHWLVYAWVPPQSVVHVAPLEIVREARHLYCRYRKRA